MEEDQSNMEKSPHKMVTWSIWMQGQVGAYGH